MEKGSGETSQYPHSVKALQLEIRRLNDLVAQLQLLHVSPYDPARAKGLAPGLPFCELWPELPNGEGIG
jgi:hypothetical protein